MQVLTEYNIASLVSDIRLGKTVVFPTETSYGLGCDATNQAAVDQIFKIKGRRSDKPLLVVVPNIEMAKQYLVWNDLLEKIAKTLIEKETIEREEFEKIIGVKSTKDKK